MLLLVIIVSYISIVLVSSFSLANQINSKSFFKYSHYVLYAVKAFVFLITVSTTATLLYFVNAKLEITSKIGQEYAILYPEFSGYDGGQPLNLSCIDLFVYAEEHDGLYMKEKFPEAEMLMGTSTAGIAHAAITATILDLPMGYVRSGHKDHGRQNQIRCV